MLTIACPDCRKDHDWPDDWVGDRVDCPSCGKVFTLERPRRRRDEEDEGDDRRDRYYDDEDDRDRRRIRRDDDEDDRNYARDGSRKRITCPRCDFEGRPRLKKEMAENAMLFIILGIFFLPLLIFGVLMKETWEVCPECGKKLRKVGGMTFG